MDELTFKIVGTGVVLVIAAALAFVATRQRGAGVPRDEAKAAELNKRADELVNSPQAK